LTAIISQTLIVMILINTIIRDCEIYYQRLQGIPPFKGGVFIT
jgi:hypothetical protein